MPNSSTEIRNEIIKIIERAINLHRDHIDCNLPHLLRLKKSSQQHTAKVKRILPKSMQEVVEKAGSVAINPKAAEADLRTVVLQHFNEVNTASIHALEKILQDFTSQKAVDCTLPQLKDVVMCNLSYAP